MEFGNSKLHIQETTVRVRTGKAKFGSSLFGFIFQFFFLLFRFFQPLCVMYKCHIYLDQLDCFHFFRDDFQDDLKNSLLALGYSEIIATNVRRCQNTVLDSTKRNVLHTKVSYFLDILRI